MYKNPQGVSKFMEKTLVFFKTVLFLKRLHKVLRRNTLLYKKESLKSDE